MKLHRRAAGLLGGGLLFIIVLTSCSVTSVPSRTRWTISGTAQFVGAAPASLAAFYYPSGSATPAPVPVSNIVALAAGTQTIFALNIDTSALAPGVGDTISLVMWDDTTPANSQLDPGETFSYCIPNAADAVFKTTATGLFVFTGSGWYLGSMPIESATETGADITISTPRS